MKVITLCGSTKFKTQFEQVNVYLTLKGHVVRTKHRDGELVSCF